MTYHEMLQYGRQTLENAGIDDAALDARYLLEWISGYSHADLILMAPKPVEETIVQRYQQVVERRAYHIPLQHITHEQSFMGYSFYVNEHVLIPRQDTEILVETAYHKIREEYRVECKPGQTAISPDKSIRILDLCCGSGCIGISLAKMLQTIGYSVDLTLADLSEEALKVAKQNADRLDCKAVLVQGDLFENIESSYQILVSNPPYIRTGDIPELMQEVKEHEPYMALDGRTDGLYYYRRIVEKLADYIEDDGYVFFEIGFDQAEDLRKIFVEHGFQNMKVQKDLTGHDRVVYAGMPGRKD